MKAMRGSACSTVSALGPKKAGDELAAAVKRGLCPSAWLQKARTETVMMSAPHSLRSAQSALKAWASFSDAVLGTRGNHLPPSIDGLVAWSRLFRRAGTYSNYISCISLACDMVGVCSDACRSRPVKRAKTALKKVEGRPREKRFISREMTATLVSFTLKIDVSVAMLYIFSYAFLLRVPSEGLPAEVGHVGDIDTPLPPGRHSRLGMRGAELVLQLAKRKNRPHGSTIIRACWCSNCDTTCPIRVLARWLETFREGERPLAHISP
jgi:hypothetical protein